ncbi:hypothetical protein QUF76_05380 [Desulfobacterales bacterium HSG16]|nr:hypothetical protein [Desulfobacterales bacterium HSG16]
MRLTIDYLAVADPDLAKRIAPFLLKKASLISEANRKILIDETLWALTEETTFGHAVGIGLASLLGEVDSNRIDVYCRKIREAGEKGPTLGRLTAMYYAPVLQQKSKNLENRFLDTLDVMLTKGTYTLKRPFETLCDLLKNRDNSQKNQEIAIAYLDLLKSVFSKEISFNRSIHLSYALPKSVYSFQSSKRIFQINEFVRIVEQDERMIDDYIDGMEKGLELLSKKALNQFITLALERWERAPELGRSFLSLESKQGAEVCESFQVTASFFQLQPGINRYLKARLGAQSPWLRPFSDMSAALQSDNSGKNALVITDGRSIWLPDEINIFNTKSENSGLYNCLVKLESACFEFDTFSFDFDKAVEQLESGKFKEQKTGAEAKIMSDLERFFNCFDCKKLAQDLFEIFEQGRIRTLLSQHYPGILRQIRPFLKQETEKLEKSGFNDPFMFFLYSRIASGIETVKNHLPESDLRFIDQIMEKFTREMEFNPTPEAAAILTWGNYPFIEKRISASYRPLKIPFGRKIRPDLLFAAFQDLEKKAHDIRELLARKGVKVYRSDLKKHMAKNDGRISLEDIKQIMISPDSDNQQKDASISDLSLPDLNDFMDTDLFDPLEAADDTEPVFWYREWDCNIGDYRKRHTLVREHVTDGSGRNFYETALTCHQGLVSRIRHAFELLKPEEISILRQWVEGDEFDYRALLDFVIDKKAGVMPSDRLYIKRMKQQRDVAVLLLVDLSRSTTSRVGKSDTRVLDVEKEAIVLFSEALNVVGDRFAIAGFSGTGRLGVDYFKVKDFDDPLNHSVKERIGAMAPQRSTRMGAAIRHATAILKTVDARVKLLIILGDGFPNDSGYKQEYAIADTRKSIAEARSANIHSRAITVNVAPDLRLDDLYGTNHNVISDVRDLPDKLLGIYNALTR